MDELELTLTRTIAAPREKVFAAWLSPDMLAQFMAPPSGGAAPSIVENDPVVGGRFSIIMVTAEKLIPHTGTYLEIDPYSRLCFTWQSPHSLDDSLVTIDFLENETGRTDIILKQVKFRSEQLRDGHIGGWNAILDNLERIVA